MYLLVPFLTPQLYIVSTYTLFLFLPYLYLSSFFNFFSIDSPAVTDISQHLYLQFWLLHKYQYCSPGGGGTERQP